MANNTKNGLLQLKNDIKNSEFARCYIMYGEESYLKEYCRTSIVDKVIDPTFKEFNLSIFSGKSLTIEKLQEAVDSYPIMAEKKLVIVEDFDLYKMPATFTDEMPKILSDLPEYICLIFYYDILQLKPDKRMKIHKILDANACFAEFAHLSNRELIDWSRRRIKALGKAIDDEVCEYLIFICGNSMTNLITEIDKVCAFSTLDYIKIYHIDNVCTRTLDAVVFDLTDAIADGKYEKAISILQDLIAQKNEEIMLFSSILRHMQRLYVAKLVEKSGASEKVFMDMINSRSTFYVRKLAASARKLNIEWLRKTMLLCGETDANLKSLNIDKQKQIEMTLLQMAANFGE